MKTNYFYYRRYLDRAIWVPLETYTYLMAREFDTEAFHTQTGIYFRGPIDGKQSNAVVTRFRALSWWRKLVTNIKAKLYYPREDEL